MLRRFKKSVLKKKLSILPSQKQSIRFLAAREKFNDDVKTISAKLAEAKKANAKVGVLELLEQLEKEHPAISKEAFACMAALISVRRGGNPISQQ
jgi:3-methyladenine DNA glycosylase AlkC